MNTATKSELSNDRARDALWAALKSGQLRDGQFLSIAQLVELLDCPIAAVREAVKHASVLGLIETMPKRGLQVMQARPEAIRACLDFRMVLDQEGVRRRIAAGALERLPELRQAHERLLRIAEAHSGGANPPEAIEVDLSLHDYIAAGLQNPHLEAVYADNRLRMAIVQNARPFVKDRVISAMSEHLEIISAMEARDVPAAEAAIKHHCEQTLRWWGVV